MTREECLAANRKDVVEFEEETVEKENMYIDQYGKPYEDGEGWPAGGGLHKDCDHNAEALYAFYAVKSRDEITAYLTARGFDPWVQSDNYEEWVKGNTMIVFEGYDAGAGQYGYVHTECV